MYVAPRPRVEDDPLFAIRLSCGAVVGFLLAIGLQSPLAMLPPALIVGLMAGMRKAFDAKKGIGAPVAMIVMVATLSFIVDLARPMPIVLVMIVWALCVLSYYVILKTGNPIGMLIAIVAVLMSVMRMDSAQAMVFMRDGFIEASLCALFAIPILYMIFPPRAKELMVEIYEPAKEGHHGLRALIRGSVLLILSFWLFSILDSSNMMIAVAAVFVLVFPTTKQLYAEAWERTVATLIGGVMALLILAVFTPIAHFPVLLILVFLGGLFIASRMIDGYYPPMVYQFAFSAMISLVAGGLSTQAPVDATILRIVLTLFGAIAAAFMTALLEQIFIRSVGTTAERRTDRAGPPGKGSSPT